MVSAALRVIWGDADGVSEGFQNERRLGRRIFRDVESEIEPTAVLILLGVYAYRMFHDVHRSGSAQTSQVCPFVSRL